MQFDLNMEVSISTMRFIAMVVVFLPVAKTINCHPGLAHQMDLPSSECCQASSHFFNITRGNNQNRSLIFCQNVHWLLKIFNLINDLNMLKYWIVFQIFGSINIFPGLCCNWGQGSTMIQICFQSRVTFRNTSTSFKIHNNWLCVGHVLISAVDMSNAISFDIAFDAYNHEYANGTLTVDEVFRLPCSPSECGVAFHDFAVSANQDLTVAQVCEWYRSATPVFQWDFDCGFSKPVMQVRNNEFHCEKIY